MKLISNYEKYMNDKTLDLDFVQHFTKLQQAHIETLQESIKDFKNE